MFKLMLIIIVGFGLVRSQYDYQLTQLGCNSRVELHYNDWICYTPLRLFMSRKVMVVATLYNQINIFFKQPMFEVLTDICTVHDNLYNFVYNYQLVRQSLGVSSLTVCPVVSQLPLNMVLVQRMTLPANLPTGYYRLNVMVLDERYVEYFDIDIFIYLRSYQPGGFFDFLFG